MAAKLKLVEKQLPQSHLSCEMSKIQFPDFSEKSGKSLSRIIEDCSSESTFFDGEFTRIGSLYS
ncbi:MAG TPA: hypothetical protein V6C85_02690 [Allocoleopsis sp.]